MSDFPECEVTLTPEEWAEFQVLLSRPPRVIPELADLLRNRRKRLAADRSEQAPHAQDQAPRYTNADEMVGLEPEQAHLLSPGQCGRLLTDGQTTCGRCTRMAHESGPCSVGPERSPQGVPPTLARGARATISGMNLRHGERVKLLDYGSIDGKWYVEHPSGKVLRYAPSDLTPEPADTTKPREPGT